MPGRRPKPAALKLLTGNPGQRPIQNEPKPRPGLPVCPPWLTGEGRREWRRVIREMGPTGTITKVDGSMLALYCALWAKFHEAISTGRHVSASDLAQFRLLGAEFGLTPSSRTRLKALPIEKIDPFDEFLRQRNANSGSA